MKSWNYGLVAGLLAGLIGAPAGVTLAATEVGTDAGTEAGSAGFEQCVAGLKQRALAEDIDPRVVDSQLDAVRHLPRVIELDRRQPEFTETFHNYLRQRVTEERVTTGRTLMREHYPLLRRLTRQYGVPPQYLVAFWGMETNFGRYLGKMNVLDALTTLACDPRRSEFFSVQLMDALRLVEAGGADHSTMLGSWAGAMGNMQFMPSAYRRFAVDADGDQVADLWNSLPDAFTSAAHFLQQLGWERNLRWGREVLLPKGFDYTQAGRDVSKPLRRWRELGLKDAVGNPVPALDLPASVIVPAGHNGPAFLVYHNFEVILGWNRSEFYALAVGLLADRINGAGGLRVSPPDDERLTVETVTFIQGALNRLGYDAGPEDGIFGSRTKRALRQWQADQGRVADGYPADQDRALLQEQVKPSAETRTLGPLSVHGQFVQGGMVTGRAPEGVAVEFQGRQLPQTAAGEFVLGFGRDAELQQQLTVTPNQQPAQSFSFTIAKRHYRLQRIEGVPSRTVNPDPADLARIRQEAGQVKTARDSDTSRDGFLQDFRWPVEGPITGVFGSQRIYNGEPRRPHFGVDIAAPRGTEIHAPADGIVTLAHPDMFFSGGTLVIDHGHGISTSYLHMNKLLVEQGEPVKQGQVVGLVGASGRATGPHLCWRLNWYQERLDPQLRVPPLTSR